MFSQLPIEIIDSICDELPNPSLKCLIITSKTFYSLAKRHLYKTITITTSQSIMKFRVHLETLIDHDGTFKDHIIPTRSLYLQCGWRIPRGMGARSSTETEILGAYAGRRIVELLSPYLETLALYRIGCYPGFAEFPPTSLPNLRKLISLEQNILRMYEAPSVLQNITHLYVGRDILSLEMELMPHLRHLRLDLIEFNLSRSIPDHLDVTPLESIIADLSRYRSLTLEGRVTSYQSLTQYEDTINKWRTWMGENGRINIGDSYELWKLGLRMMPGVWETTGLECAWDANWNPSEEAKLYKAIF